jgi:Txe/YoeB family toxin of Txe-Axe toxin-antitoxin module
MKTGAPKPIIYQPPNEYNRIVDKTKRLFYTLQVLDFEINKFKYYYQVIHIIL